MQVPLYNAEEAHSMWRRDIEVDDSIDSNAIDSWQWWHRFRSAANFNLKIRVVLELNEGERPSDDVIRRWLGEPVEAVLIPSNLFIRNRHNFPVLPKAWQDVLAHFARSKINLIVSTDTDDNSLKHYADYLMNFRETYKDSHELQA